MAGRVESISKLVLGWCCVLEGLLISNCIKATETVPEILQLPVEQPYSSCVKFIETLVLSSNR